MSESIGSVLGDVVRDLGYGRKRGLVRNREPRPLSPANRLLWGAMMTRDGRRCWICGHTGDGLVMDHLRPRSSFLPHEMHEADRSDNLRMACWDCNAEKSNRLIPFSRPVPIVWEVFEEPAPGEATFAAFVARTREVSQVAAGTPIARLRGGES